MGWDENCEMGVGISAYSHFPQWEIGLVPFPIPLWDGMGWEWELRVGSDTLFWGLSVRQRLNDLSYLLWGYFPPGPSAIPRRIWRDVRKVCRIRFREELGSEKVDFLWEGTD